jgi:hypothetical protein
VVVVKRASRASISETLIPRQRIKPGLSTTEKETPWREIVGVVGDIRHQRLSEKARRPFSVPRQGLIPPLRVPPNNTP